MLEIVKCLKCGSTAELSQGSLRALCMGGCPEMPANAKNFEIYSIEGNIFEWIEWVRGRPASPQGEDSQG